MRTTRWVWGAGILGLVVLGGGWALTRTGSPPVDAAASSTARARPTVQTTTAVGAPAIPAPATCCGGTTGTTTSSGATQAATAAEPAYHLTSITGHTLSWPQPGVTVLYFMSAQCGSCIQGERQLAGLQTTAPAAVHFISLDVTPQVDTQRRVAAMAQRAGAQWPQAFATPAILTAYHVTALDQIAVVNAQGHVVYDGSLPSNGQLLGMIRHAAE